MSHLHWLLMDLDNTLLDFDLAAQNALQHSFRAFKISNEEQAHATYRKVNGQCWSEFEEGLIDVNTLKRKRFQCFVQELELDIDSEAINRYYLKRLAGEVHFIKGAMAFLSWAEKHFHLLLVTNGFAEVQRPRIINAGFPRFFRNIVISEEIGSQKPAQAFFDHTHGLIGPVEKDHIMIVGDSLSSDIAGGLNYGIKTCWFNRHGGPSEHCQPTPDYIVSDFLTLKSMLSEQLLGFRNPQTQP